MIISLRIRVGKKLKNKSCFFKNSVIKYIGNKIGKGGETFAEY